MKIDLIPHLLPIATAAEAHGKGSIRRNFAMTEWKMWHSKSTNLTKRYHMKVERKIKPRWT